MEKKTKGHGGKRKGAGRPKGSTEDKVRQKALDDLVRQTQELNMGY